MWVKRVAAEMCMTLISDFIVSGANPI